MRLLTCDSTSAETWKKLKDGPMTKFANLVKEHTGHGATLVIGSPPWGVLTDDKGGRLKSRRKKARESKADKEEADGAEGDGDDVKEESDQDEPWRTWTKDPEYVNDEKVVTQVQKNFSSRVIVHANRDGEMPLRLLTCDSTLEPSWAKLRDGPMKKFADLVKEHTGHGATPAVFLRQRITVTTTSTSVKGLSPESISGTGVQVSRAGAGPP